MNTVISASQKKRVRKSSRLAKTVSKSYHLLKKWTKKYGLQKFLLNTLSINLGPVGSALVNKGESGVIHIKEDRKGKHLPANKTKPDILNEVKRHIESFPVIESHYCRPQTKRKYLDSSYYQFLKCMTYTKRRK